MFLDLVYQRHPSCHFTEPTWSPAADVMVSEDSARVIMELAGVPRENVRVRLQGRILEVSGRRHSPKDPALSHYHRAEILFGDFRRVIELPWEADEKRVGEPLEGDLAIGKLLSERFSGGQLDGAVTVLHVERFKEADEEAV